MASKWTRNQKIAVWAIIVSAMVGFLGKINLDIRYLNQEIKSLKIKTAEIDQLKSRIAEVEELVTKRINMGTVMMKTEGNIVSIGPSENAP